MFVSLLPALNIITFSVSSPILVQVEETTTDQIWDIAVNLRIKQCMKNGGY